MAGIGEISTKKRKRVRVEFDDTATTAPSRPQKSRILENGAPEAPGAAESVANNPTKSGKSRQEKSERRAKKHKKFISNDPCAEKSNGDGGVTKAEPKSAMTKKVTDDNLSTDCTSKDAIAIDVTNSNDTELKSGEDKRLSKKNSRKNTTINSLVPDNVTLSTEPVARPPSTDRKQQRFILFIGNLPYSATTPQIQSHFIKLTPKSIRHSTDKSTGRSKGFAFLEFDGYDKMKTCLKLYHHSIFDPQEGPKVEQDKRKEKRGPGRRINVELTVGGGGARSDNRKEKIKGKNQRLEEQRERRRITELGEGTKEMKERKPTNPATDASATPHVGKEMDMGDIHPTRRARVG